MKALKDYQVEGQLSIFDVFNLDIPSTKMYPEPLVPTTVKISEPCLKKPAKWQMKTPMFLDLRKDKNGLTPDVSWGTDIRSLGEYITQDGTVSHKEESDYVYLLTMGGGTAAELLFELVGETDDSETFKAIADIREQSRPEVQLIPESMSRDSESCKKEGQRITQIAENGSSETIGVGRTFDVRISSEGTINQRAHCYETDRSRALDTGGENPDSNHGGIAIIQKCYSQDAYDKYVENSNSPTIKVKE